MVLQFGEQAIAVVVDIEELPACIGQRAVEAAGSES